MIPLVSRGVVCSYRNYHAIFGMLRGQMKLHEWCGVGSGVMSQNIGGGGAQSLRGSVATERGEGVSHDRELFIFRLEYVQSGAYLRRKFRRIFINHLYGIENKPWFNFIWGGGGGGKPPPPPPHQYASGSRCLSGIINWIVTSTNNTSG